MSWLRGALNWAASWVSWLGLWDRRCTLVLLGLDNAGKSTLLHMLAHGTLRAFEPTLHPNCNSVRIAGHTFQAHDLGGHLAARVLWRHYTCTADAIVFMVDAADRERMAEARAELGTLMADEALADVPILVLGNKVDLPGAASAEALAAALGVEEMQRERTPGIRPMELAMCSVVKGMGYRDGFEWLARVV